MNSWLKTFNSRDQVGTPPSLLKRCCTPEYPISPPTWEKSTFFSSIKEQRPLIFLFIESRQNQLRQRPPSLVLVWDTLCGWVFIDEKIAFQAVKPESSPAFTRVSAVAAAGADSEGQKLLFWKRRRVGTWHNFQVKERGCKTLTLSDLHYYLHYFTFKIQKRIISALSWMHIVAHWLTTLSLCKGWHRHSINVYTRIKYFWFSLHMTH